MRNIEFKIRLRNKVTGETAIDYVSLDDLLSRNGCYWDGGFKWEIISKDEYIGRNDNREQKIYEKNIVKISWSKPSRGGYMQSGDDYVEHEEIAIVKYITPSFRFLKGNGEEITFPQDADLEVVGDFYSDPELLGDK